MQAGEVVRLQIQYQGPSWFDRLGLMSGHTAAQLIADRKLRDARSQVERFAHTLNGSFEDIIRVGSLTSTAPLPKANWMTKT